MKMAIASGRSLVFSIRAASSHNPDPHLSSPPSSCPPSSSSSSSSHGLSSTARRMSLKTQLVKDTGITHNNSRAVAVAAATTDSGAALYLLSSSQQWVAKATEGGMVSLRHAAVVAGLAGQALRAWRERILSYKNLFSAIQLQASIEKVILDTRFSTLIAVAGSLIGSVVCFIEGCFLVLEAFFHYFHTMWQHAAVDQGEMMHLLIEAIDMFLVGTGLLNFGMAMYIMFVGSRGARSYTNLAGASAPNLAGIFHQMMHRPSMGTKWVYHAKAKLGHAVVMILQAGTVEKFTNVPMANGLDLACFAGAVLLSSASVFLLSRLHHVAASAPTSSSMSSSSSSGSGGGNQEEAAE